MANIDVSQIRNVLLGKATPKNTKKEVVNQPIQTKKDGEELLKNGSLAYSSMGMANVAINKKNHQFSNIQNQLLTSEEIGQTNLIGFKTEEEYKNYIINMFTSNLNNMKASFANQNDNDGLSAKAYNAIKDFFNLGVTNKDIENAIKEQEEMILELKKSANGESEKSFEETFENYTGTKYSKENIDKYLQIADIYNSVMVGMQTDENFAQKFHTKTGHSVDNLAKELAKIQIETFGKSKELQNIVEKYSIDQNVFADKLSNVTSTVGLGCIAIGTILTLIPKSATKSIGLAMIKTGRPLAVGGMFIDNAIDLVDSASDKNGLTKKEAWNLAVETGVDITSYKTGQMIGKFTNGIHSILSSKASHAGIGKIGSYILGQGAETVSDATLSLGADYVIAQGDSFLRTGKGLNKKEYWSLERFLGEGKNQLLGILTGLSSAKLQSQTPSDKPTVPKDTKPTIPQDTKPTVPKDTKPTIPQDTKPTVPQDTKPTVPQDTKTTVTEDTKPTVPKDTKPTVPQDTKTTVTEDTKQTVPKDTKTTVTEDIKEDITPEVKNHQTRKTVSDTDVQKFTKELLEYTSKVSDREQKFTTTDIEKIVEAYKKNPETTKELITYFQQGEKRCNNDEIITILKEFEDGDAERKAIIKRIIDENITEDNESRFRFNGTGILNLIKVANADNIEDIIKFANVKCLENKYARLTSTEIIRILNEIDKNDYDALARLFSHQVITVDRAKSFFNNQKNSKLSRDEYFDTLNYLLKLKLEDSPKYLFAQNDDMIRAILNVDPASVEASNMQMLIQLVESGEVGQHVLRHFPLDAKLSEEAVQDIDKAYDAHIRHIKPIDYFVPKIKVGETPKVEIGDVFQVEGEKFIRIKTGDNSYEPLKLTRETYFKLFPPIERYSATQNKIGNCWQISGFNGVMCDPRTRSHLLKLFTEENGNIYIQYPNSEIRTEFANGEMPKGVDTEHFYSNTAKGIQMLEFADGNELYNLKYQGMKYKIEEKYKDYGPEIVQQHLDEFEKAFKENPYNLEMDLKKVTWKKYVDTEKRFGLTFENYISKIRAGGVTHYLLERIGLKNTRQINKKEVSEKPSKCLNTTIEGQTSEQIRQLLINPQTFKDNILFFATSGEGTEQSIKEEKGLVSNHGYRMSPGIEQNGEIKSFKLINPWGIAECELNIDEILNNLRCISMSNVN